MNIIAQAYKSLGLSHSLNSMPEKVDAVRDLCIALEAGLDIKSTTETMVTFERFSGLYAQKKPRYFSRNCYYDMQLHRTLPFMAWRNGNIRAFSANCTEANQKIQLDCDRHDIGGRAVGRKPKVVKMIEAEDPEVGEKVRKGGHALGSNALRCPSALLPSHLSPLTLHLSSTYAPIIQFPMADVATGTGRTQGGQDS